MRIESAATTSPPLEAIAPSPQILLFAPTGNDAPVTANFLTQIGHTVEICEDMAELCRKVEKSVDLILLAEETLNEHSVAILRKTLSHQPPWSDIPITIITSGGEASPERLRILASIGSRGNVGLLERPFRRGTLLSTVEVALRARQQQYRVRELLEERKEAQARLEELVKERTAELTEANAQLETLVYSIAHDLRAPLRSMQAFSRMLLEDYASQMDPTAENYAQRIMRSAEAMDTLVLDLLAYGKTARADIVLETVDLEGAWHLALAQFEQDIKERQAVITTVLPLPPVHAHPATLVQVLANLLGNALKFVAPGIVPHIVLRAEKTNHSVRLSLEDNGIGIAPEYHDKIFRVFERLQSDHSNGTGIGLAIVRKGIERMNGRVGVKSGDGKPGSVFWIELAAAQMKS